MKHKHQRLRRAFLAALMAMIVASPCFAEKRSIEGEINDSYQLVETKTGKIFEIAENDIGNDLVKYYISERVKVVGTVAEREDMSIITVIHFEVIPD